MGALDRIVDVRDHRLSRLILEAGPGYTLIARPWNAQAMSLLVDDVLDQSVGVGRRLGAIARDHTPDHLLIDGDRPGVTHEVAGEVVAFWVLPAERTMAAGVE